jgi:hypothetical protein
MVSISDGFKEELLSEDEPPMPSTANPADYISRSGEEIIGVSPAWYLRLTYEDDQGKMFKHRFLLPFPSLHANGQGQLILIVIKNDGDASIELHKDL